MHHLPVERTVSDATRARRLAACLLFLATCGCDSPPSPIPNDAGADDAATNDTGADDAATDDAATSDAGLPLPDRVQAIVDTLRPAMYDCPDRVWPGIASAYRSSSQILLVDSAGGTAYLFNDRRGSPSDLVVTQIDADGLAPEWGALLHLGVINGVATFGVSLDETGDVNELLDMHGVPYWHDYAVNIALRGAFYFLSGQREWSAGAGTRAIRYPEPWEPRYVRAELTRSLLAIVTGEPGASPATARYWLDAFETDHAGAAAEIATTDVLDGSAHYAELVGAALGGLGCDADESALEAAMLAHLGEFTRRRVEAYDGESSGLGVAAGLLLRRGMMGGWEAMVEAGVPPARVFLADETAVAAPDDPALRDEVMAAVAERNAETAAQVEPMLARLDSTEHYRLPIPEDWLAGALVGAGSYILTERVGAPTARLALAAEFISPSGDQVTLAEHTVISSADTPCPGLTDVYVAQVARADVTEVGGEYSAAASDVMFANLTATVVVSDGIEWLCPTVAE